MWLWHTEHRLKVEEGTQNNYVTVFGQILHPSCSRCHMFISNISKNGILLFCPLTQIHSHTIGETIVFICVTHILLKNGKSFKCITGVIALPVLKASLQVGLLWRLRLQDRVAGHTQTASTMQDNEASPCCIVTVTGWPSRCVSLYQLTALWAREEKRNIMLGP